MKKKEIKSTYHRKCDFPECENPGIHRAPRDRSLQSHYWFCLQHVQEYNKKWNYLTGLSADEIEHHLQHDTTWQRPTWKLGQFGPGAQTQTRTRDPFKLRTDSGFGMDGKHNPPKAQIPQDKNLTAAIEFMEITTPLTLAEVKRQYKKLAKKYHPDTGHETSEDGRFQKLTESYQIILSFLKK